MNKQTANRLITAVKIAREMGYNQCAFTLIAKDYTTHRKFACYIGAVLIGLGYTEEDIYNIQSIEDAHHLLRKRGVYISIGDRERIINQNDKYSYLSYAPTNEFILEELVDD